MILTCETCERTTCTVADPAPGPSPELPSDWSAIIVPGRPVRVFCPACIAARRQHRGQQATP